MLAGSLWAGLQADVGEIARAQSSEQRLPAQAQATAFRLSVWSKRMVLKHRCDVVNGPDRAPRWSCKPPANTVTTWGSANRCLPRDKSASGRTTASALEGCEVVYSDHDNLFGLDLPGCQVVIDTVEQFARFLYFSHSPDPSAVSGLWIKNNG